MKRMNDKGEIVSFTWQDRNEEELCEIKGKTVYYNGIVNGHPFSSEKDYSLFTDLPIDYQKLCCYWVNKYCIPAASYHRFRTSYGMKHILEQCTKIYMTNNQFKDLMMIKGFAPKNPHCLNWSFKVREAPLREAEKTKTPIQLQELKLGYPKQKPTYRLNGRVTCYYCEEDVNSGWEICPSCYTEIDWD